MSAAVLVGMWVSPEIREGVRQLHKVESVGQPRKGPQRTIEQTAAEIFEQAVLERFEHVTGLKLSEWMKRRTTPASATSARGRCRQLPAASPNSERKGA